MDKFNKIISDIKSVKIQGATNVSKAALKAYSLKPTKNTIKKLISLRPTEPSMFHSLKLVEKKSIEDILFHFTKSQEKINLEILKLVRNKKIIFTHCHSSTVSSALIYSRDFSKKFEVYSTETRPLYQGRITAKELANKNIKVTSFVDSAMRQAINSSDLILIGADAILKKGVINKIGSATIAEIANNHKKPVYIVSDSWKYYPKKVKIEERDFHEVWKNAPKNVKVRNPAFELVPKKMISKIISEFGVLSYQKFLRKVSN